MYGRKWVAVTSGRGAATLLVQVEKKVAAPVATAAWTIGGDGEEQQPRWWRGYDRGYYGRGKRGDIVVHDNATAEEGSSGNTVVRDNAVTEGSNNDIAMHEWAATVGSSDCSGRWQGWPTTMKRRVGTEVAEVTEVTWLTGRG
ncbi:hypothetical protein BHE74_00011353 [Ensete ventricosum]|nr:hypothetical protein GW17_00062340 [Ensete ventricosum]RWW80302.1 hypothetical protein BHE74_00011353 [Ensete ventricosum]